MFKLRELLRDEPPVLHVRDRCPTGKTVFVTKAAARRTLRGLNARQRPMHVYRCAFCSRYHVGHRRGQV